MLNNVPAPRVLERKVRKESRLATVQYQHLLILSTLQLSHL